MACEVNNKEINSQCAELLVRPTYIIAYSYTYILLQMSLKYLHPLNITVSLAKQSKLEAEYNLYPLLVWRKTCLYHPNVFKPLFTPDHKNYILKTFW